MRVPFPKLCSPLSAGQALTCHNGVIPRRWDLVHSSGGNGARPQAYDLPVSST